MKTARANWETGGTGNLPVPPDYQLGGMGKTLCWQDELPKSRTRSFPFRSAGWRPGQAGSLFYRCEA